MDQPLSLGEIARASGADLLATRALTPAQIKVLRSIAVHIPTGTFLLAVKVLSRRFALL